MNAQGRTSQQAYNLLRFWSLLDPDHGFALPCDSEGRVDVDSLSDRALNKYLCVRALVARDQSTPVVELAAAQVDVIGRYCREMAGLDTLGRGPANDREGNRNGNAQCRNARRRAAAGDRDGSPDGSVAASLVQPHATLIRIVPVLIVFDRLS